MGKKMINLKEWWKNGGWKEFIKRQTFTKSIFLILLISFVFWILFFIRIWKGIYGVINPFFYEYILLFKSSFNLYLWMIMSYLLDLILIYILVLIITLVIKLFLFITKKDTKLVNIWISVSYSFFIIPFDELRKFIPIPYFARVIIYLEWLILVLLIAYNLSSFTKFSKKFTLISLSFFIVLVFVLQILFPVQSVDVKDINSFSGYVGNTQIFNQSNLISVCTEPKCLNIEHCYNSKTGWVCSFDFSITIDKLSSERFKSSIERLELKQGYLNETLNYLVNDEPFSEVELSADLKGQDISELNVLVKGVGDSKRTAAINALIRIAEIQKLILSKQ